VAAAASHTGAVRHGPAAGWRNAAAYLQDPLPYLEGVARAGGVTRVPFPGHHSFVFVSDVGEVTQLFKKTDVSTAVDLATASRVINLSANSNYGHALKLFRDTWLGSITRRTTVIVIGDGRSNYNPPNAWALADVKRKCRRLIWLCPEEQHSWGFGDSEMPLYARHCDRVESVRSLDDLARAAAELMP